MKRFRLSSDVETRLDLALLEELRKEIPTLARRELKRVFESGQILIQGRAASSSHRLAAQASIEVDIDLALLRHAPEARTSERGCFLEIAYEDSDLLVLHKISGIPSLPHQADETDTAVSAALAHFPLLSQVGKRGLEPGLLHRLDTGTSGLLAFAKTQESYEWLRTAWKTGGVKKVYRAIVTEKKIPLLPLTIRTPLGHDERSARRMRALPARIRGKPLAATTHLLKSRAHPLGTDLEIEIETGVMHQIRAHLASIGLPILGDPIYGDTQAERLWLHAWRLEIKKPDGSMLRLEAPLPPGFVVS